MREEKRIYWKSKPLKSELEEENIAVAQILCADFGSQTTDQSTVSQDSLESSGM